MNDSHVSWISIGTQDEPAYVRISDIVAVYSVGFGVPFSLAEEQVVVHTPNAAAAILTPYGVIPSLHSADEILHRIEAVLQG